jgi:signal recognition particle subunit SEC65
MGKRKGGHMVKMKMDGGANNALALPPSMMGAGGAPGGMMNPMNMMNMMGGGDNKMDEEQEELLQQLNAAPISPDRKYQIFWPMHETFSMKTAGFQVIYPQYIDGTKSVAQGRRIAQSKAVSPSPSVVDLSMALQALGLRHVMQPNKGYSRDIATTWYNPGRVLADIRNSSHQNKRDLLLKMAEIIPSLPGRIARLEREAKEQAEAKAKVEQARQKYLQQQQPTTVGSSGAATTKGTSTTSKKKAGSTKKGGKKK